MIQANELRIGNFVYVNDVITRVNSISDSGINIEACAGYYPGEAGLEPDAYFIKWQSHSSLITPIPLTEEWLLKLGAIKRIVCKSCGKISSSKLCYKDCNGGDYQCREQAEQNGLYINCTEPKETTEYFNLYGFNIFYGLTGVSLFQKENPTDWNFGSPSWNINVKINYIHDLQNIYFFLTREELEIK